MIVVMLLCGLRVVVCGMGIASAWRGWGYQSHDFHMVLGNMKKIEDFQVGSLND